VKGAWAERDRVQTPPAAQLFAVDSPPDAFWT
jgi:hypothetical protein